jgi:hypothetical protein
MRKYLPGEAVNVSGSICTSLSNLQVQERRAWLDELRFTIQYQSYLHM